MKKLGKRRLLIVIAALLMLMGACSSQKKASEVTPSVQGEVGTQQQASEDYEKPPSADESAETVRESNKLKVHFIDVGQGDSAFIELPDGKTMLIDAGDTEYGDTVSSYISSCGVNSIDYVVCSHPHSDHIGGMEEVIGDFSIGDIYMSYADSTSRIYEKLLEAIADKGEQITTLWAGDTLAQTENYTISVLAPVTEYTEINNSSLVLKLTYGSSDFLFMGDAETKSERAITADVEAEVVKVGHHGSDTSSSTSFVSRVDADYAIISVGKGNSYNLPTQKATTAWSSSGARLLRTDEMGSIIFVSDGSSLSFNSTKAEVSPSLSEVKKAEPTGADASTGNYILNTSTKKVHTADCSAAGQIKDENRETSDKSPATLTAAGYTPCKRCNPF